MSCVSCASAGKMALTKLNGVLGTHVRLKEEKAEGKYREDNRPMARMIKAVGKSAVSAAFRFDGNPRP